MSTPPVSPPPVSLPLSPSLQSEPQQVTHAAAQRWTKDRSLRPLITPEGVNLGARLADVSSRFGALTLDLLFITLAMFLGAFTVSSITSADLGNETAQVLIILLFFALRSFYFMGFEMGPRAATPGKRILKIRVAARDTATLRTSSVFARNALREIELFLPIQVLLFGGLSNSNSELGGWIWLAMVIWFFGFAFFPLMNRDRLRVGDLVAGTWVVRSPKPVLLPDLSDTEAARSGQFAFRADQLAAYGIHELHILEDVLRQRDPRIMSEVSARIRDKIGWVPQPGEIDYSFLKAYYAGLRGQLETGLLMGRRRKDKFDTS